jgi:isochorismate hydrolase
MPESAIQTTVEWEGIKMAYDYDAMHRDVLDYFSSRKLAWGQKDFGIKPAILIIDMAYGWTDPQYAGGSLRISEAVDWIARLLEVARPLGVPVVYTTSPTSLCPLV